LVVSIKSGDLDILAAGSVLAAPDEGITFNLDDLTIRILFKDDDSNSHRLDNEIVGEKELEIYAYNFNNSLGTGTSAPLPIGTIGKRELFLAFWAYLQGNKKPSAVRSVTYTFYQGRVVDGE